ncbi:MAG: hypothetical protein EXX96DRAFT_551315, partial [Benjaminiella poitrasii]
MMEIDTTNPSKRHKALPSYETYDDTDISETDTELSTPNTAGGYLTEDPFIKRVSSSSSSNSSYYPKKTKSVSKLIEKVSMLENEIHKHVKREAELESQILILQQTNKNRDALGRIYKHIDRFLLKKKPSVNDSVVWSSTDDWQGSEIPLLFGDNKCNVSTNEKRRSQNTATSHIVFVLRLKSIVDNFTTLIKACCSSESKEEMTQDFFSELSNILNAWQEHHYAFVQTEEKKREKEYNRVARLLEALQKSLLKNKIMQRDNELLLNQYKMDAKRWLEREKKLCSRQQESRKSEQDPNEVKQQQIINSQIQQMEKALLSCQEERDEYEKTLEIMRREMEAMLEELEDTRQQRLRYKTQANRLRAGLEAIQRKSEKNEDESMTEDEEDEEREATKLMQREAERQAADLDRECKRQALTISAVRKELKLTEEKYQLFRTAKSKQIQQLEKINRETLRKVELLEIAQQQSESTSSLHRNNAADEEEQQNAKIYLLKIALKAANSDAVLQRTRIYQLERQNNLLLDLSQCVNQLQGIFQKELEQTSLVVTSSSAKNNKDIADSIECEQRLWKKERLKEFQRKYDVDLLRVNRDIRFLACRLAEIEEEMELMNTKHDAELKLLKYNTCMEYERRLEKLSSEHCTKEDRLKGQIDALYQENKTLQDESLVLYGRNIIMAHELGKL